MPPTTQSATDSPQKKIFVISPIGKKDDSGFDFSDLVLDEIVKPAAAEVPGFGTPERADEVQAPGSITSRIVQAIVDADVCIADLTGRNPNVMYEVAIAHAADKPVILLQQEAGGPPFDFASERVIHYGTRADLANTARRQLVEFLRNAHQEAENELLARTMHPVRLIFKGLQTRAEATDPQQEILKQLDTISQSIEKLESERNVSTSTSPELSRNADGQTKYLRAKDFLGFAIDPEASEFKGSRRMVEGVRAIAGKTLATTLAKRIDEGLVSEEYAAAITQLLLEAYRRPELTNEERNAISHNLGQIIDNIPPF